MRILRIECARMRKHKANVAANVRRSKAESPILEQVHRDRMKRCATAIRKAEDCVEAAKKLVQQSKELLSRAS